jgi:hypothetical protein
MLTLVVEAAIDGGLEVLADPTKVAPGATTGGGAIGLAPDAAAGGGTGDAPPGEGPAGPGALSTMKDCNTRA